jgi:hypothetical protein
MVRLFQREELSPTDQNRRQSFKLAVVGVSSGIALMIITGASSCGGNLGGSQPSNSGATEVQFTVTGTAPSGVDITYGSDSSNYQGQLPLDKTLAIDKHAAYYAVTAQLQGAATSRARSRSATRREPATRLAVTTSARRS